MVGLSAQNKEAAAYWCRKAAAELAKADSMSAPRDTERNDTAAVSAAAAPVSIDHGNHDPVDNTMESIGVTKTDDYIITG